MKLKIRETGEIVDVISFSCDTERKTTDAVDYIDSKGIEHHNEKLNYYWDLEPMHTSNIDWEQRRYEIAKSCLHAILEHDGASGYTNRPTDEYIEKALEYTNALIKELKK